MKWQSTLPDVSQWQPESNHNENLSVGLLLTCQAAQNRIIAEAELERGSNVNNFDSGPGVEDIVRQELSKLLPGRYLVDAGVINDRQGRTGGGYDIVIRNALWAPVVKLGATPASRRFHFPIESIYSAIEVKQTLGFQELDKAMEKLVRLSRLTRPHTPYGHITENQHLRHLDRDSCILNPLHTVVLGTRMQDGVSFQDIALRFGEINGLLHRDDMVTQLCLLNHGTASYTVKNRDFGFVEATFMWDREMPLFLGVNNKDESHTFYRCFIQILGHLTRSVLEVHDLHRLYGVSNSANEHFAHDKALYNRNDTRRM